MWICTPVSPPSRFTGASSHNSNLKAALARHGIEVVESTSYCLNESIEYTSFKKRLFTIAKAVLPSWTSSVLRDIYSIRTNASVAATIRRRIEELRPTLLYERYSDFHSALDIARGAQIPYVLEVHATEEERVHRGVRCLNKRYRKHLCETALGADAVVVVSEELKLELAREGVAPDKMLVMGNAVDDAIFTPRNMRAETRARLRLGNNVAVGFVGSFQHFHGVHYLPELCVRARPSVPDIKFVLIGNGDTEHGRALQQEIRARRLQESFIFCGHKAASDVPPLLEAVDICIIPDATEYGSPVKLFEYGAMAKACMVPNYRPITELITHNESGLVFEAKDVTEMTRCLVRLATDIRLREHCGARLQAKVLDKYTWHANGAVLSQRIRELTHRAR